MKEISNGLILAGYYLSNDEFVMQWLNGLTNEYDDITNINSQKKTLGIDEVLSLLLGQEIHSQQTMVEFN